MPWEHTSAITQNGTLKSEVRTSHVIHHSDVVTLGKFLEPVS